MADLRAGIRESFRTADNAPAADLDCSKVRALLISNPTMQGGSYLEHCAQTIRDFLGQKKNVLFVPYGLADADADADGYTAKARTAFAAMGHDLTSLHACKDMLQAVNHADAIFLAGGNAFRLLKALRDLDPLRMIRRRALGGVPYIGSDAGADVATLSLRTTNDMPIVLPPSLKALQLVPFQINTHFPDPDPHGERAGETREERLRQFHEEHDTPVLGLREGRLLRVEGARADLLGTTRAWLFMRGHEPRELTPPCDLSFLLQSAPA